MASLQNTAGKKRWLPLAVAVIIAGAVYVVTDNPEEAMLSPADMPAPLPVATPQTADKTEPLNIALAQRQANAGNHTGALATLNLFLDQNPEHMDALLLKASVLVRLGSSAEAETLLSSLRQTYPHRPEPLNNLAVIYAEAGDHNRAIETLQQAFLTHPGYARVYRNLSDMYAVLAAEAYNKALGQDNNPTGPRLALLDQFGTEGVPVQDEMLSQAPVEPPPAEPISTPGLSVIRSARAAVALTETPEPLISRPAEPARSELIADTPVTVTASAQNYTNVLMDKADSDAIVAARDTIPSEAGNVQADIRLPETRISPAEEQAISQETKRAEQLLASLDRNPTAILSPAAPVRTSPALAESPAEAVRQHLHNWATAWSGQHVDRYVSAYADNYRPASGNSHRDWIKNRTLRLSEPAFIKVTLGDIRVNLLSGTRAEASFRQVYRSDRYQDVEQKRMSLVRTASGWKITREAKE
ncbi:MAG: tetratricopeptide repeat protein [Pontibacterium sp.]